MFFIEKGNTKITTIYCRTVPNRLYHKAKCKPCECIVACTCRLSKLMQTSNIPMIAHLFIPSPLLYSVHLVITATITLIISPTSKHASSSLGRIRGERKAAPYKQSSQTTRTRTKLIIVEIIEGIPMAVSNVVVQRWTRYSTCLQHTLSHAAEIPYCSSLVAS